MRFKPLSLLLLATLTTSTACDPNLTGGGGDDKSDQFAAPVCRNTAFFDDPVLMNFLAAGDPADVVTNFTAWPEYDPNSSDVRVPRDVVDTDGLSQSDARDRLAAAFPGCEDAVRKHLDEEKPNVYIYFSGYGGAVQNNSITQSPAILNWINQRDPNALIFAINWNCDAESTDSFCRKNALEMTLGEGDPAFDRMKSVFENAPAGLVPGNPLDVFEQAAPQFSGEGTAGFGYDSAMSHSIHLAARLVDQLLVASQDGGIGDIHFVGYSMGAQSAARVLSQDFVGDGSGFQWQADGVCEDGSASCTLAKLKKVRWSLSMGLPGWSEAMVSYRADAQGSDGFRDQYGNGGLLRLQDLAYNNKLNILNRRMDPTSDSDDTLIRFLGDIVFGDYNHYSHDYAHPLFIQPGFTRLLESFLAAKQPTDVLEAGIVYDNAGYLTFDDCDPDELRCDASTNYLAHPINRSHSGLDIPRIANVVTTDGVGESGKAIAFGSNGSEPFMLNTFDQEDLRGAIEMYYRPNYDPAANTETRGLFSYGSCDTATGDLMPEAYLDDGLIIFAMTYQGQRYAASVDASSLQAEEWAHLAFSWELPVVSLTHEQPSAAALQKHGLAFGIAQGLMRPLRTTYRRQMGIGSMKIHVNGQEVVSAPLGTVDSQRECLSVEDVLVGGRYEVNGSTFEPYLPYAGYTIAGANVASIQPSQALGTVCKPYRIPNQQVFFGCAQSDGVSNADGDMDEVIIVWGPGRSSFDNVGEDGQKQDWPVGD